jgi:hypothetical protein
MGTGTYIPWQRDASSVGVRAQELGRKVAEDVCGRALLAGNKPNIGNNARRHSRREKGGTLNNLLQFRGMHHELQMGADDESQSNDAEEHALRCEATSSSVIVTAAASLPVASARRSPKAAMCWPAASPEKAAA